MLYVQRGALVPCASGCSSAWRVSSAASWRRRLGRCLARCGLMNIATHFLLATICSLGALLWSITSPSAQVAERLLFDPSPVHDAQFAPQLNSAAASRESPILVAPAGSAQVGWPWGHQPSPQLNPTESRTDRHPEPVDQPSIAPGRGVSEQGRAGGSPPFGDPPRQHQDFTSAGTRPTFNCRRARTTVERTICADPLLAAKDRRMATLYEQAGGSRYGPVDAVQRRWLARRDRCARVRKQLGHCIHQAYDARIAELTSAGDSASR